jgi:3-methyladenine DNA glycosylase Tag
MPRLAVIWLTAGRASAAAGPACSSDMIQATVHNARQVLAMLDSYGSIRAYFASFPDAHAASADMRRRFKFLGDTGVWRLLTSAARDIGG